MTARNPLAICCSISTLVWIGASLTLLGEDASSTADLNPNSKLVSALVEDASLNAIASSSEDRLCAVGERGAILFSDNAGHTWQLLPNVTTCNLYGVAFNGQVGLAVGGLVGTRVGLSRGVVLRSEDGGATWKVASTQPARLRGVQFVNDRWMAWGDYDPLLQSSIVESLDGGTNWRAIAGDIGHVSAATWSRQDNGLAVDSLGRCWRTALKQSREAISANLAIQQVVHDGQRWWACGSHGTCLVSQDGLVWDEVALPLSPAARDCIDFRSIVSLEGQMWLVGDPGSLLFRSPDRGQTWKRVETQQTQPIYALHFIDRNRGWMVGAQGAIWATRDGGLSWFAQRRGAQRIGLLAVMERADEIPWSPLIATVWEERLPVATLAMSQGEPLERSNFVVDANSRVACLAPQAGISSHTAWSLPAASNLQATQRLAVAIRTWRPDIVLGSESMSRSRLQRRNRLDALRAIELAASTIGELSIADELALPNWQVSKLAAVTEPPLSEYSEDDNRILKSVGLTIWDLRLHLPAESLGAESNVPMRTVWARSQAAVVRSSLLGGIARKPDVVRQPFEKPLGNYQLVMGRAHRLRSLQELVAQPKLTTSPERWKTEFDFLQRTLPDAEAGWLLIDQAKHALRLGRFDRHRILLEAILDRFPNEDTAEWARWELLRLSSSDEFRAWRAAVDVHAAADWVQLAAGLERAAAPPASPFDEPAVQFASQSPGSSQGVMPAAAAVAVASTQPAEAPQAVTPQGQIVSNNELNVKKEQIENPGIIQNNGLNQGGRLGSSASTQPAMAGTHASRWLQELSTFTRMDPYILSRPDGRLLFGKNLAEVGNEAGQRLQLDAILQPTWMVGWGRAARQETFINSRRVTELKWVAFADFAPQPPVLDGRLDEACWSRVPRMRLQRVDEGEGDAIRQPAIIAWAYDRDYLYVGLECPRQSSRLVKPPIQREYDAQLAALDHCTLLLDTDRDYCTAVELSIAEDGQTNDRCCGYASYNPRWHVSVDAQGTKWSAEVAIPLDALTQSPEITGHAWGVSAYRFSPEGEPESWSQLKDYRPSLNANGLLLFVPALK